MIIIVGRYHLMAELLGLFDGIIRLEMKIIRRFRGSIMNVLLTRIIWVVYLPGGIGISDYGEFSLKR